MRQLVDMITLSFTTRMRGRTRGTGTEPWHTRPAGLLKVPVPSAVGCLEMQSCVRLEDYSKR